MKRQGGRGRTSRRCRGSHGRSRRRSPRGHAEQRRAGFNGVQPRPHVGAVDRVADGGQPLARGVEVVGGRRRGGREIPRCRATRAWSIAVDGAPRRCRRHSKCRIHGVGDRRRCSRTCFRWYNLGCRHPHSSTAAEAATTTATSMATEAARRSPDGKDDAACHGEESHSLLEVYQQPELMRRRDDWRPPAIILGFECLESMAFNGIATNLVVYIRSVLHGGIASSASTVSLWYGTTFFVPIIGAVIADAYWGNYKTVLISLVMYLLGMVLITVGAFIPSAPALCNLVSCPSSKGTQNLIFFSGLYLAAVGCGGVRSALLPLGADQFNNENSLDRQKRRNFFSLFYICVIFGVITSGTIVVWVQENVSWSIGYGIATTCIALALVCFMIGTPIFRWREPSGSPVKSIFQVTVAAFKNMRLEIPADTSLLYETRSKDTHKVEPKLAHTDDFRFLDKAAVISDLSFDNGNCESSWRICTITQVEELKILIRLLPIWATGVFFGAAISQMHSTFIQQGTVMNTKIGSLSVPPASLYSFEVICVTLWVLLINKVIVPAARTCSASGAELTQLQRIGIGRFLMIFAMAMAAILETKRLESVQYGEPLSIVWQLPQYIVIAGAECFAIITQLEFFHGEAPDSMKSMLTAFALLTTALGNYLSSAIITLVAGVTRAWRSPGWIPDDLNEGHLDYFYWCLAAISVANFVVYIYFASKYKLKKVVIVG